MIDRSKKRSCRRGQSSRSSCSYNVRFTVSMVTCVISMRLARHVYDKKRRRFTRVARIIGYESMIHRDSFAPYRIRFLLKQFTMLQLSSTLRFPDKGIQIHRVTKLFRFDVKLSFDGQRTSTFTKVKLAFNYISRVYVFSITRTMRRSEKKLENSEGRILYNIERVQ